MQKKFLEIGPGRGDFLFHLAVENPLATVVGVEYKHKRFDKLMRRLEKRALTNVRLFLGDARAVLPQEFGDGEFDRIFVLFSDPWPKRRHARHRLFQDDFVKELHRVLKGDGQIFIAHDDPRYLAQIEEVFQGFRDSFTFLEEGIDFQTFYADKWLKEGRKLRSFSYIKTYGGIPCAVTTIENPRNLSQSPTRSGLRDL